jgi:hypothetical protein
MMARCRYELVERDSRCVNFAVRYFDVLLNRCVCSNAPSEMEALMVRFSLWFGSFFFFLKKNKNTVMFVSQHWLLSDRTPLAEGQSFGVRFVPHLTNYY